MVFDSLKNKFQLRFKNRETAASILDGALEDSLRKIKVDKKKDELLVLGIPRGGVVVAEIVYSRLKSSFYNCEFDIIVPRRLGAPGNQEIGIGAIITDEDGTTSTSYLNESLIKELDISNEHIEREKERQIKEIRRRNSLYRSSSSSNNIKEEYDLKDKIVILIDDGAATGATLIAATRWIRKKSPKKLIIAISVSPKDTVDLLKKESDIVVTGTVSSLSTFKSVAQFYQDFKPVDDDKVIEICKRHNLVSN